METTSESPVLDLRQFMDVTMGDPDLMHELLEILIADVTRLAGPLREAIARRDPVECAKLAHYGRGGCANLGACAAYALLDQLERSAVERDFTSCAAQLERLPGELARLRAAAAVPA